MRTRLLSLALCLALASPLAFAAPEKQDPDPVELTSALEGLLERALDSPRDAAQVTSVFDACVLELGSSDALVDQLDGLVEGSEPGSEQRLAALWIGADIAYRRGDLADALDRMELLHAEDSGSVEVVLRHAELLDVVGREKPARQTYEALLEGELEEGLETRIRLRIALLDGETKRAAAGSTSSSPTRMVVIGGRVQRSGGSTGNKLSRPASEAGAALATFAAVEGRDAQLRNRAAVVLGLLGHAREALDLHQVHGEGRERFRSLLRRAEWAIDAGDGPAAQALAWEALEIAPLARHRRHALTVLVEAHRTDKSLPLLIGRFETAKELGDDARNVWIDLLRETGRYQDALALFREGHGLQEGESGEFTVEMRRRLLEMARQSGNEELLLSAYREMIAAEPGRIEWREGLARAHLERSEPEAALAVWAIDDAAPVTATYRLAAADALMTLGLDEQAAEYAELCVVEGRGRYPALLFLGRLHASRGRLPEALAALERMAELAPPGEPARMQLSEAFEQLGQKDRAVEVLETVLEARGEGDGGEDLEMRLAWLYSELGREEDALARWRSLWERVESVPRRRYVEDRLMTVASRLGKLADVVVELEERLAAGSTNPRESGLLIRIYTKVNDAVSATEIIDEYMRLTGADRVKSLNEKALVYLACTEYAEYEDTLEELMEIDAEGRVEYLQQLAMSKLERGRLDEARVVLTRLGEEEQSDETAEFQAGVLALAGLREDAAAAYRRGIAGKPDHIDSYLLLANVMKDLGQTERAVGMFQYLIANAEKDDLFTVAVDGLLNLEAQPNVLRWTRRVTLERLASRHDKMYLYRLHADLSEELKEPDAQMLALEAALPISGERRTALLRELMDLSAARDYRSLRLEYGRRLLGTGELVPPQVYLDLGEAFLAGGDVVNAEKTFSRASDLPDYDEFRRKVAQSFEKAGFLRQAQETYSRLLISRANDVSLITKVAELHEQLGSDERARVLYERAIAMLLGRRPLSVTQKQGEEEEKDTSPFRFWQPRNVGEYDQYAPRVQRGLLVTLPDAAAAARLMAEVRARLDADLASVEPAEDAKLESFPRLADRAALVRRLAIAFHEPATADAVDLALLAKFPRDEGLLEELVRARLAWGLGASAQALIEGAEHPAFEKDALRYLVGAGRTAAPAGSLPVVEAARMLVPLWRDGREDQVRELLLRVDLATQEKEALGGMPSLLWSALELRDPELVLAVGRAWIRLAARTLRSYETTQQLDLILGRCDALLGESQMRSLADTLVQLIVDDPKKHTQLIAALPQLQERFDEPLLTSEKAIELIETLAAQRAWGMGDLLRLIPEEETLGAIRAVVEKTPKARRAPVIPSLLAGLEMHVEGEIAEYSVKAFEDGLADVQDEWYMRYALINSPVRNAQNVPLFVRFAEKLVAKDPGDINNAVAYAGFLDQVGRKDEALEVALDRYGSYLSRSNPDWQWKNGIRQLLDRFGSAHGPAFESRLEEAISRRGGATPELELRRIELLGTPPDPQRLLDVLTAAVERHPKNNDLRQRLQNQLRALGRAVDGIAQLEAMIVNQPERQDLYKRLESDWARLRHPVNALEVRGRAEQASKRSEQERGANEDERFPPATIQVVQKALEDEDPERARTTFRRLWRMFDLDPRFLQFQFKWRIDQMRWPVVRERAKGERPRGGLESFESWKEPARLKTVWAYDALAETDFGEPEMTRLLRTLDAEQLAQVRTVQGGLVAALAKRDGVDATLSRLVERMGSGRSGRVDASLVLSLIEQHPESVTPALRVVVDDLTRTADPWDGNAIRRLARVHASLGDADAARRLYRWCAYLSSAGGVWGLDKITPLAAREIVDEVVESLEGDARRDVVETLLRAADPGEEHWGRDQFERLVLVTWEKVAGPEEALRRTAPLLGRITDTEHAYKRETAKFAAYLLARNGQVDDALAMLEFALCKAPETAATATMPAWQRMRRQNGAFLNTLDVRRLFPGEDAEWKPGPAWLERAADGLEQWVEEGRTDADRAFTTRVVLALRLHQAGRTDRARALFERIDASAGPRLGRRLWLLDLARRLGDEQRARRIERELLDQRALYIERIPEALDHIAETDGAAAARAVGETVTEYTLHPVVLERLEALASSAADEEAVARLIALRAAGQEAEKTLEDEQD